MNAPGRQEGGCTLGGMSSDRERLIRALFDEYIEMYAARDERLTARFSKDFSGYAGGGHLLVKDMDEWLAVTRLDFAQVPDRLRIEMLDLCLQNLSDEVVVVTAFFHIHLPIPDHILSKETARLVLIFRLEGEDWKIVHSGISIPYHLVREGEVYPMAGLHERNLELAALVEERTHALEEANDRLEALSNTDWLTGIANRRDFDRSLAEEWRRADRTGTPVALVMIDVDQFKEFNDLYGHQAGDRCLKALGGALARERRAGEIAARYGGEEFVVLLSGADECDAEFVARRIQERIWSLVIPNAATTAGIVTVSLGIASQVPSPLNTPEDLVRQADSALYRAKQQGRNRVQR